MISDVMNAIASTLALFASYLSQRSLERTMQRDERMEMMEEKMDILIEYFERHEGRLKRTLPPNNAELDGLNGDFYPTGTPQADELSYAKILEVLAKLPADVARSLEILADLQARFPPSAPMDTANPPV